MAHLISIPALNTEFCDPVLGPCYFRASQRPDAKSRALGNSSDGVMVLGISTDAEVADKIACRVPASAPSGGIMCHAILGGVYVEGVSALPGTVAVHWAKDYRIRVVGGSERMCAATRELLRDFAAERLGLPKPERHLQDFREQAVDPGDDLGLPPQGNEDVYGM